MARNSGQTSVNLAKSCRPQRIVAGKFRWKFARAAVGLQLGRRGLGDGSESQTIPSHYPLSLWTMRRVARHFLWWAVILGGLGGMLFLRKSESDHIRDDLEAIADAVRFTSRPPSRAWVAALRTCLAEHLADPVSLDIAPIGEVSLSTDPLLDNILAFASNHAGLGVSLGNIGIKIDTNGRRATAKGEAHLDVLELSGERRGEPRKFAATLVKNTDAWVLVHVQITEPRIDQPEARP